MATVNEYYQRYWDAPESYNDPTTPQRQQLPAASRVLDLGCGRGEFCAFFKRLGFVPEGIDISGQVIEHARSPHPGIAFHAGEVQELLPGRAGAFNCVFSSGVIEHLFDVGDDLRDANQLLRPEGLFLLTTPYHGFLKNVMIDALDYSGHYDPLGQHIRCFDRRGLENCLAKFRFRPFVWTGYGRPWPFWKSFFVVCRKERDAETAA